MSAISHNAGGDLLLSSTGGLAVVFGADQTKQMILRRLTTNLGDYIWNLDYGAGLPAKIGDPVQASTIQGIVQSQMALEQGVDHSQPVTVSVTAVSVANGQYRCDISYTDLASGLVQGLSVVN